MPLNPITLATGFIAPSLISTLNIGSAMPKLALGIANGVCNFFIGAVAVSIDTGTLGVGTSAQPLIIPPPTILAALLVGYSAQSILGPMSPLNALGVANGISTGLASLATASVQHPGVGAGAAIMRIVGSSAVPALLKGFADAGLTGNGSVKMATAIGIGLDTIFQSFVMPLVIAGPPSIIPGAGSGFGVII